jgi:hypothetical protein
MVASSKRILSVGVSPATPLKPTALMKLLPAIVPCEFHCHPMTTLLEWVITSNGVNPHYAAPKRRMISSRI